MHPRRHELCCCRYLKTDKKKEYIQRPTIKTPEFVVTFAPGGGCRWRVLGFAETVKVPKKLNMWLVLTVLAINFILTFHLSEEETWHCSSNSFYISYGLVIKYLIDGKHFSSVPLSSIIMANDHCLYWSQWFHYNFPGPPFNLQFLWNLKAMEKGLPDHQKWDYKVTAEKSKTVHIWESL